MGAGICVLATPAAAATHAASLVLSTPSKIGVAGKAITVRERGFGAAGANFVFVYLQPSGTHCARTEEADAGRPNVSRVDYAEFGYGRFNHLDQSGLGISPAPGVYRLCGYLDPDDMSSTDPDASRPSAVATVVLGRRDRLTQGRKHERRHAG